MSDQDTPSKVIDFRTRAAFEPDPVPPGPTEDAHIDTISQIRVEELLEAICNGEVSGVTFVARKKDGGFLCQICLPPDTQPEVAAPAYHGALAMVQTDLVDIATFGVDVMNGEPEDWAG
jgi:hypothetical protein